MLRWQSFVVAALVGLTGVSLTCKREGDLNLDMATTGVDANIAATLRVANQGEIDAGQLAQAQATDARVKTFALRMLNEHTAAQARQNAIYFRLGILPADSATSRRLQTEARTVLDALRMEMGVAFDVAYLDSQIAMHTRVLDVISGELLPAVQSSEIKAELTRMRDDVSMHLMDAQQLRDMLGSGRDGGAGDGGAGDGGVSDGGAGDGGTRDGGTRDGGTGDGGATDGGMRDGGTSDAGMRG